MYPKNGINTSTELYSVMRAAMVAILAIAAVMPIAAYATETASLGENTFLFVPGESIAIMDVTIPYIPLEVASIPVASGEFAHVPISGGAYLAAMGADDSLHVWDVTVPYRPVPVSVLPDPTGGASGDVSDVDWAISGERTFALLSAGDRVYVVDVTDPRNPAPAGDIRNGQQSINALDEARDSEAFSMGQETYVLVAGSDSVQIVDFSVPTAPVGVSVIRQGQYNFETVGALQDVDVVEAGGGVYALILGETSLMVADVTDPAYPKHVDTLRYNTLFEVDVLETEDALYALIMCVEKVHVIDMGDPDSPVAVATVPIPTARVAGIESEGGNWILSVGDTIAAADITNPKSAAPAYVREGGPPHFPEAVETAVIDGKLYALTASVADSTIQITDVTDMDSPAPVSAVVGGQHSQGAMHGPHDIAVAETGGGTYAVVPNVYSDAVTVLDVGTPGEPRIVSSVKLPVLRAPMSAAVFDAGASTYAAVAGYYGDGVRLLNVTDPRSPVLGVLIKNGQYGFEAMGDTLSVDAVAINGSPYVLVANYFESSVQVIDVSDPSAPVPAAALFDGVDGHDLKGAHDIRAVNTGDGAFAVVSTTRDSGISVIDISDPRAPAPASHVVDGQGGFDNLDTVQHLDVVNHGGRTLVAATSYFDNAVQLLDITDPGAPAPLPSAVNGQDGFEALIGPTGVSAVSYGTGAYLVVADYFGNGIQMAEITAEPALEAASAVAAGLVPSLPLAITAGVESATISGRTYAFTASPSWDAVQVTDITDTLSPTPVALLRDGEGGFVMDGPAGITVGSVSGGHYAFVTGVESESIQTVDVSDPAMPEPVHVMREGLGWVIETELVRIGQTPYLVVASLNGDALHVIDVSDPSMPDTVASLPDAIPGIQGLDVVRTPDSTLAIIFSFDVGAMSIIDITDPDNPRQVGAVDGEEYLQSVTDVDAIVTGDRVLAVVASYRTDTVAVLDITDPREPTLLSSVQGNEGGNYIHGPESAQVVAIGDGVFVAVANGNNSLQLMDITDPLRPVLASPTGILYDSSTYGITDVEIVEAGPNTYVLFQTIDENVTKILDATDPYGPVPLPPIPPVHRAASFQ